VVAVLNVRISRELQDELERLAAQKRVTKSDLVKEALTKYLEEQKSEPYEAGKDLFGCDDSEIVDGSVEYKHKLRAELTAKHSR
jgi:Arc/MetJ-type ribon-helix-helix transcriptional regulator